VQGDCPIITRTATPLGHAGPHSGAQGLWEASTVKELQRVLNPPSDGMRKGISVTVFSGGGQGLQIKNNYHHQWKRQED
jgi:hypothetical protein